MSNFQKNQKAVFSKLYRYYCVKLLKRIWVSAIWFLYSLLIMWSSLRLFNKLLNNANNWQNKLAVFWFASFLQLVALMLMMSPFVSYLVGRGLGWEELKKKQFFHMPKISREEDIKVLIFTPDVDRQTIIWAKFAAAFTYFMVINFLFLALPLTIYFLIAAKLEIFACFSFLLLNGIGFALLNFLLIVPFLFYQQEGGSFLVYFLCFTFLIFLVLTGYFLWGFVSRYPLVFCMLSVPFSILTGHLFFSLYRKKFLKNDLD